MWKTYRLKISFLQFSMLIFTFYFLKSKRQDRTFMSTTTEINPKFIALIEKALPFRRQQIIQTINLLEDGATIPFIARYRKEMTGSLDEVAVADIQKAYKKLQEIEKRKETILKSIEEQGKLTGDLRQRIESSYNLTELEDIYLPYKRKRRTRATKAREKGLEPLALRIFKQIDSDQTDRLAQDYLNDEVPDIEAALQGARDIIAELINEHEQARNTIRRQFKREAVIYSKVARGKETEGAKYKDYFDFSEALSKVPSHRLLAMRRGEEEGFLRVIITPDDDEYFHVVHFSVRSGIRTHANIR